MERLSFSNFILRFATHPCSHELVRTDRKKALLSTLILGILSLGAFQLGCLIVSSSRKRKIAPISNRQDPQKKKIDQIADRITRHFQTHLIQDIDKEQVENIELLWNIEDFDAVTKNGSQSDSKPIKSYLKNFVKDVIDQFADLKNGEAKLRWYAIVKKENREYLGLSGTFDRDWNFTAHGKENVSSDDLEEWKNCVLKEMGREPD